MKQKTHSGLKKRVKVKKSGKLMIQKSCKNHLLSNKSKRQKKSHSSGMNIDGTRMQSLRRLLPNSAKVRRTGIVAVKTEKVEKAEKVEEAEAKK